VNNVVSRLVVDMRNNVGDRINSLRVLTMMPTRPTWKPK
jgi:methyl-accepting chemotaxis protein